MGPLGHIQHRPGDIRMASNQVKPKWHIRHQGPVGAKMVPNQVVPNIAHKMSKIKWCQDGTCHYNTYNINDRYYLAFNVLCVVLAPLGIQCPLCHVGTTWELMCCRFFLFSADIKRVNFNNPVLFITSRNQSQGGVFLLFRKYNKKCLYKPNKLTLVPLCSIWWGFPVMRIDLHYQWQGGESSLFKKVSRVFQYEPKEPTIWLQIWFFCLKNYIYIWKN